MPGAPTCMLRIDLTCAAGTRAQADVGAWSPPARVVVVPPAVELLEQAPSNKGRMAATVSSPIRRPRWEVADTWSPYTGILVRPPQIPATGPARRPRG